jgi:acyl-[acyl-carrier-protein]-phospholipid O-acyltransferase / long-chain-fatty-acid--[acyl-carrier-protein] ligase
MSNRNSLKSFWYLIATQFQGAFSDMAYKQLLSLVALSTAMSEAQGNTRISLISALFSLPFLFFSMFGGFLADRFSKRSVTLWTKLAEVFIMLVGTYAAWNSDLRLGMAVLFLMGAQAATFGPTKYSILPEVLPESRLSWGNGILEMTTFLAVILGTVGGSFLSEIFHAQIYWAGIILVSLALVGVSTSSGIGRLPIANLEARFEPNFLKSIFRAIAIARQDRVLWLAVAGSVYFWFLGVLFQTNIMLFGKNALHLQDSHVGYLMAFLALGIGTGSYVAGIVSGTKIEYGLIPLGAIGICFFAAILGFPGWSFWVAAVLISLLGFSSGFFIVPLNALLQHRPDPGVKGSIVAMSNLMTFVGMLVASGLYWVLTVPIHLPPHFVFLTGALLTLVATIYVCWLLPDSLIRLVLWLLTHSIYRIRTLGRENIPEKGGVLFVCNHLSFVDALLLIASTDRFIRFLIEEQIYEFPLIKPFARMMGVIPVSSRQGPRALIHSLREASSVIQKGEVVCIFAEGQITRTGQLLPFRRGFERIMRNVEAPIIPVCLDRVWGSIFSFQKGRFFWKMPRVSFQPVTVAFGDPISGQSTAEAVRQAVQELASDAFVLRKPDQTQLPLVFIRQARQHPFRFAAADGMNPRVTSFGMLYRSLFLARLLNPRWKDQKMVGLFLPPSVAGAVANIAVMLCGKVPVNLNYTVSQEILDSCVKQCGIRTIVTSHQFLEKIKLAVPETPIFLEDLAQFKTVARLLMAFLQATLVPAGILRRFLGAESNGSVDDLATIIFSSGSTGDPKGVMLSHHNILSNIEGMNQVFTVTRRDRILGILPFFHSFGFTGTLWFPLIAGMGGVYHPNPLEARVIGALTWRYKASILLATPTFLQSYLRRCQPEDFGSLRFVMVGAEKLSDRLSWAFEEKFGIRPLEGYGCTECSPIVSVNVQDFRAPGFYQVGQKKGRIGHPLPGVTVKIVDPETKEFLPVGKVGLLLVKGPNVMLGYLNRPEKTDEVIQKGWYTTGDLAMKDADGFVTITDRLSRFSKIGGEMVPHLKVEEVLSGLTGTSELNFAVAGIPDEKKGERLVVLHTLSEEKIKQVQSELQNSGLPNIWVPRPNAFFRVEKIPVLGTGKLDLRLVRETAIKLAGKAAL